MALTPTPLTKRYSDVVSVLRDDGAGVGVSPVDVNNVPHVITDSASETRINHTVEVSATVLAPVQVANTALDPLWVLGV